MFPVEALDHEDTRYFRSTHTSYQGRLGDALSAHGLAAYDTGGMMPAYSEFLGDYGAAAVSRIWWPAGYHQGVVNLLWRGRTRCWWTRHQCDSTQFKPDIKRWLHISR